MAMPSWYYSLTHALTRPKVTVGYVVGGLASIATLAASVIAAVQPLQGIPFISQHLVPIVTIAATVGAVCTAGAAIGHSVMNLFPDYVPSTPPPPAPPKA